VETIEVDEGHAKAGRLGSGHAEMVGRRPQMEDVSVVIVNRPAQAKGGFVKDIRVAGIVGVFGDQRPGVT
jgi:hypothetical protein